MGEASIIGLGAMGSALARALLRDGHRVTVWNRTSAKADPLVRNGAVLAPSAASTVGASPTVVVCVDDYEVTNRILETPPTSPKPIVTGTQSSATAAKRVRAGGARTNGACPGRLRRSL